MKRSHLLFSSALLSLALVACSDESSDTTSATTPNDEGEEAATPEESSDEQIVIEHAFGETVLDEKPERVATVQWGNQDIALALGVEPVGFSAANYGVQDDSGLLPWTKDQLDELGVTDPNIYQDTDGLDFEAISDSNPDVILASYSGITQEDYDLLTQIAPVVAYPTTPWTTPWREQVLMNAEGMGMKAEGEQLIADTEATIDDALEDYPEIEGKSVVWVNFSADDLSNLHLYTPADTRVSFLKEELGLSTPDDVEAMIENKDEFYLSLSAENADVLNDADIIIGYGDEDLYEAVKSDSRLGQIPAVERGSVVMVGNATPLAAAGTPNPLSIEYTIEEYVELLGDAVEKVDE